MSSIFLCCILKENAVVQKTIMKIFHHYKNIFFSWWKKIFPPWKKKKIFHDSIFPNAILQTQQLWRPLLSHTDIKRRWQRETNSNVWVWIHFIPSGTWSQFYISLGNNVQEKVVSHATLKFTRCPPCWFSSTSTCPQRHRDTETDLHSGSFQNRTIWFKATSTDEWMIRRNQVPLHQRDKGTILNMTFAGEKVPSWRFQSSFCLLVTKKLIFE